MKTTKIDLQHLRNEEHYQFHSEFNDSVILLGADKLDISEPYQAYTPFYNQEQKALLLVRGSVFTKQIEDADKDRDDIYGGFADAIKSALKHFNLEKRAAANRIQNLLDTYGDVPRKSYDQETADITKLTGELSSTYKTDITTLALTDWVTELGTRNTAFDTLKKSRTTEGANKTDLRMVNVRKDIDKAYHTITDRLDALMLLNGTAKYEAFVRELNTRVERYNNTIAIRQGRAAKNNKKGGTDTTDTTKK
ncbi:MAG TPA: DUF6261 family protein [Bacteroidales bacterium]